MILTIKVASSGLPVSDLLVDGIGMAEAAGALVSFLQSFRFFLPVFTGAPGLA